MENTDNKSIFKLVLITEGVLFLLALLWGYLAKINPFLSIYYNFSQIIFAIFFSILLLGLNFLAVNVFSKVIPFFKKLKEAYEEICSIAVNVNIFQALMIALLSGFAEEIFFRGVLLEHIGLFASSAIFGMLHIGGKKTLHYGIYSFFIGLLFGWLYLYTENLLVPIIVHVLNNFLALPYMRYYYKKHLKNASVLV